MILESTPRRVRSVNERDWTSTRRRTRCSDSALGNARSDQGRPSGRSRREIYHVVIPRTITWYKAPYSPLATVFNGRILGLAREDRKSATLMVSPRRARNGRPARKPAVRLLERSKHRLRAISGFDL